MRKPSVLIRLLSQHPAYIPELLAQNDWGSYNPMTHSPYLCNMAELSCVDLTPDEVKLLREYVRIRLPFNTLLYSHFLRRQWPFTNAAVLQFWEGYAKNLESIGL